MLLDTEQAAGLTISRAAEKERALQCSLDSVHEREP